MIVTNVLRDWDLSKTESLSNMSQWIIPATSSTVGIQSNFDKCCCTDKTNVFNLEIEYNPSPYLEQLNTIIYGKKLLDEENKIENLKGENEMGMFDSKLFGKIQNGMCRLSMQGGIAVKTSNGYKTYNLKSNRLVNCSNFVFDIGEEFFFVIPTNKVERGDIILVNGKPKCVMEAGDNTITVINYEDSVVETILPERHVFMGNTYFYGKIVSMFGNDILKGDKGMKKMMSYMLMSEMMKGNKDSGNAMSSMLPLMMLGSSGGVGEIFGDLFDDDTVEAKESDETDEK